MLSVTKFQTTSPLYARTAARRAVELYVHSFSSEKERTKKADQRALPFGIPCRFAAHLFGSLGCFAPLSQRRASKALFSEISCIRVKETRIHKGGASPQVFAAFFKPQTRDFHQTKSSSRALAECEQSEQFRHLKRLAVLREAERVKGEALTRFFGYFFDARQKSNTRQGRRSVAATTHR